MVAAVRALGRGAEDFLLARGAHLAAAARALITDGGARAREIARLDAAPPEGVERVHPSWWRRPPPSTRPSARAFLERAATAHLVAMPAADGEPFGLNALEGLDGEELVELGLALGRRRVAQAFSTAPQGSLAQLCARLGEPAASQLLAEARALRPSHDEVRAAQRSLFKLAVDVRGPSALLPAAGARWLAPSLASRGGDLLQRVAQRMPEPQGRALCAQAAAPATAEEWASCEQAVLEWYRARPD